MLDKEEEAADFFASQASVVENLKDFQNTEKTVAFFYINTSGAAVVRNPEDYISNMIELGGARNASVISRTTAEKHPCRSRWSSSTIRPKMRTT